MQKPNTKLHWTALAVARYYDRFGTACRARDLYPYVRDIHNTPDDLISALTHLGDVLDHINVESPSKNGSTSMAFAYYPTPVTIEELRDIGEPTELPDGSPVPEDIDPSIPSARIADGEEVPPPTDGGQVGLQYENMGVTRDRPRGGHREYDTSNLQDVDVSLALPSADIEDDTTTDDDTDDVACPYCHRTFDSPNAMGGHKRHCLDQLHLDALHAKALEEYEAHMDEKSASCPYCDRTFDSGRAMGGHKHHCLRAIHAEAREEHAEHSDDEDAVDLTEFEPSTSDDPIGDVDPIGPSLPTAGSHSGDVDWNRIGSRIERKAADAHDAGLDEVASAYSQFATLAVEGDLDKRVAFILLGTPVLELEDMAVINA